MGVDHPLRNESVLERNTNVDAGGVNTLSRSAVGCRTE